MPFPFSPRDEAAIAEGWVSAGGARHKEWGLCRGSGAGCVAVPAAGGSEGAEDGPGAVSALGLLLWVVVWPFAARRLVPWCVGW